jgi:hypothetical protein
VDQVQRRGVRSEGFEGRCGGAAGDRGERLELGDGGQGAVAGGVLHRGRPRAVPRRRIGRRVQRLFNGLCGVFSRVVRDRVLR